MGLMYMYDLFPETMLRKAIDEGLVKVRRHPTSDYFIYNYSDSAMWTEGAWDNPAVRYCRGLIVDNVGNVVARPWEKFFNYGQGEAAKIDLDEMVFPSDKVDGSLGILFSDGDLPVVATRGSFDSEQARHATEWLKENHPEWRIPELGITPLVEIVYPENRIVCDYGDADELVLLGGVHIESGEYYTPYGAAVLLEWPGEVAHMLPAMTFKEALELPPRPGAEGRVLMTADNRMVKLKQEDYVRLHRFVTGMSERKIWEAMMEGKTLEEILEGLPDELIGWARGVYCGFDREIKAQLNEATDCYQAIISMLEAKTDERPIPRKMFAEVVSKMPNASLIFGIYDERPLYQQVLKSLKPKGDSRFKIISEDVA